MFKVGQKVRLVSLLDDDGEEFNIPSVHNPVGMVGVVTEVTGAPMGVHVQFGPHNRNSYYNHNLVPSERDPKLLYDIENDTLYQRKDLSSVRRFEILAQNRKLLGPIPLIAPPAPKVNEGVLGRLARQPDEGRIPVEDHIAFGEPAVPPAPAPAKKEDTRKVQKIEGKIDKLIFELEKHENNPKKTDEILAKIDALVEQL